LPGVESISRKKSRREERKVHGQKESRAGKYDKDLAKFLTNQKGVLKG